MKNNTNLISLAAFITIVGVIVEPLSLLGGVYSWPCGRMAVAVAFLYMGCYIAGKWSTKIDRKWRIRLLCATFVTLTPTKFTFELESEPENVQD